MKQETTANIGTPETLPITELNLYDRNPRQGDVQAIKASMLANGIFRPIVVNRGTHTGKPNQVLAGNHSLKAMRELTEDNPDDTRWSMVNVWMVDVDEEHAAKIVLADNRTADLGSYDNEELIGLMEGLQGDLDGTGYDEDDLAILLDMTAGPDSLDDLEDEFGEPEDDDFWITVRLRIPPVLNEQWKDWVRGYDSEEEAFEALLDKGNDYGQA